MISVSNISVQFGGRVLFKNVSFRIGTHDRIGLVGSNGAGKTTLLRILVGDSAPDLGDVAKARFVTVGYLPQEGMTVEGRSLYKEAEAVFGDIIDTQTRLEDIHRQMAVLPHETEEFNELLELYGELQHKLEASDAFRMRARIEKVLIGLGFKERDFNRDTREFSGGWQMRIHLAKLLLMQPSLLLLDEPTNHLDLDSLQWLEEYLRTYEGAVIIVSHDRRFLDNMTTRTYELSLGALTEYPGNYSAFVEARQERLEQQLAAYRNQQQQIKQTEQFIERFRYKATKARQVQSRIKQLEKMEVIELEDEEGRIHFHFPPAPPAGKVMLTLRGIVKRYGTLELFNGVDLEIDRGDRIAFVGVNGAGKSTLSRIIAGVEPFDGGTRTPGHNAVISYFAQHQAEELNPQQDVLQTVEQVAAGEVRKHLRNLLGSFLFRGDDVFKKVGVLSGGEKSRLALAKMLLQPTNLVILDEPTNHLDMRSKEVLQEALAEFDGSFVIVSHDRDFLAPLINKVVEFHDGAMKTYPGTLDDYLYKKQKELTARQQEETSAGGRPASTQAAERDRRRLEAELRQQRYEATKPLQDRIAKLEKSIESFETEKAEIEHRMVDPDFYKDGERVKEITARYRELDGLLTDGYFRWNELTRELERLSVEFQKKAEKLKAKGQK